MALGTLLGMGAMGLVAMPATSQTVRPMEVPPTTDGPPATVTITGVEPASPSAGDTLSLAGRLTNSGVETLFDPTVVLRLDATPLDDRDEIRIAATEPLYRYGVPDYRYVDELTSLPPTTSAPFSLEVPIDALDLPETGVYVVGVDVLSTLSSGLRPFVASARTVIPVTGIAAEGQSRGDDAEEMPPIDVALVWRVAAAPTVLADGRVLNGRLVDRLAPGGLLYNQVDAAAKSPVTWLVDPDLVASVARFGREYQVVGQSEPMPPSSSANAWLALLDNAIGPDDEVRVTPYAEPDVGLMLAGGWDRGMVTDTLRGALQDGVIVADAVGNDVSSFVYPRGGWLDPAASEVVIDAGAGHVALLADTVLASDGITGVGLGPTARLAGPQSRTPAASLLDPGIYAALEQGWEGVRRAVDVRQRFLAETAMAALQGSQTTGGLGGGDDLAEPLVGALPHDWAVTRAVMDAVIDAFTTTEWVEPVRLRDVREGGQPVVTTAAPSVTLPPLEPIEVPLQVSTLSEEAEQVTSLLVEPERASQSFQRSSYRALSTAWRTSPQQGLRYTRVLASGLTGAEALVRVVAPASVTLSSRTGQFPITVVNDLAADVQVQLRLRASNADRLTVVDPAPQVVRSGEKQTIRITAQAAGNGRVPVVVRMETIQGQPVGSPVSTLVVATDYGLIGWAIVGFGVLTIAVTLFRRVRGREEAR